MTKTNLTIQLDSDVVRSAKTLAAKRGTSVSALVANEILELVERDDRYEQAHREALGLMDDAERHGGITWSREDIYTERLDRHGR
jgi:hypothetical protein